MIQTGCFSLNHRKTRIFYFCCFSQNFSADNKLDSNGYSLSKFQVNSSKIGSSKAMSNSKHKRSPLSRPWINIYMQPPIKSKLINFTNCLKVSAQYLKYLAHQALSKKKHFDSILPTPDLLNQLINI
jgi:hypothetical protein